MKDSSFYLQKTTGFDRVDFWLIMYVVLWKREKKLIIYKSEKWTFGVIIIRRAWVMRKIILKSIIYSKKHLPPHVENSWQKGYEKSDERFTNLINKILLEYWDISAELNLFIVPFAMRIIPYYLLYGNVLYIHKKQYNNWNLWTLDN